MLVIRRRAGEMLLIGDNIEIEILETGMNQVKLGISAPREISILRKEIADTAKENRQAAQSLESFTGLLNRFRGNPQNPSSRGSSSR